MDILDFDHLKKVVVVPTTTPKPISVVKLSTTWYIGSNNSLHKKQSLTFLKRKSNTENYLYEDAINSSPKDTFESIVNLNECKDGIYQVVYCNISRDYETGYPESWDLKLIPYETEEK